MIPEKINIGGHEVEIKAVDHNRKTEQNLGINFRWQNYIEIASESVASIQEETLAHEILHGVLFASGAFHQISKEQEESLVTCMANVFWRFLKDNTNFFDRTNLMSRIENEGYVSCLREIETLIDKNPERDTSDFIRLEYLRDAISEYEKKFVIS